MPHARRALAFFSRKRFWHSSKKHVVSFKMVFKNQSSFFSETSSLTPINIQELNRHFLANVPGKDPHIWIPTIHAAGLGVFAFSHMYMSCYATLDCHISCPQCMPAHSNHAPQPASTPNPEHPHTRGSTLSKQEPPAHPTEGRNPQRAESKRLVASN